MWEIIGVGAAVVVAIIGVMTYFESKRDRKIKENREAWKKRDAILKGEILEETDKRYATKSCLEDMKKDLETIKEKIDDHFTESLASERDRLASEIITFAEDIKNKLPKSSVAYEHIHKCYARYKKIGGNSYIDKVFHYINDSQEGEK